MEKQWKTWAGENGESPWFNEQETGLGKQQAVGNSQKESSLREEGADPSKTHQPTSPILRAPIP